MKKIATTLAALVVTGGVMASPANASGNWICDVLSSQPNKAGVSAIIYELIEEGYTDSNGGPEFFASSVINGCPEYIPAVQKALDQLT